MVLEPGTWVTETVRLEHRIARGGMAEIWQAEHVTLGAKVAVKCLSPQLARRAEALRRFLNEAQIVARLGDPHTVRVFDCVVRHDAAGDPLAFLVMELLEGEDLGVHLESHGCLTLEETTAIVQQVARALETAHALDIVHRDVKPENIFLAEHAGRLSVRLLDFGVAKYLGASQGLTLVGVTLGTPQYMSPEQLEGARDVDARCDVWSLAVVAYACLTGHRPFEGRTAAAVSAAIHDGSPRCPTGHRPDLPASVDSAFVRAFHPRIESRFQSTRDLADALAGIGGKVRPGVVQEGPVLPVITSRVCIIGEPYESYPSIPFDLVRPVNAQLVARPPG